MSVVLNGRSLLLAAAQALEFGEGLRPGRGVRAAYDMVRSVVPPLHGDRAQAPDISALERLVDRGEIVRAAEEEVGRLGL